MSLEKQFIPFNEKYYDKIQSMRYLDDDFMRVALDENNEAVQDILQIVMKNNTLKVTRVVAQKEIKNIFGRSVRLDVYACDDKGKRYNIEIQRSDEGARPKRARHNQSLIDAHVLEAGVNPELLPEVYVIFFTESDVYHAGKPMYHVDRVIRETNADFLDEEHIIYVNGSYTGNDDLGIQMLASDFRQTDPNKIQLESLSRRMKYLKFSEEGVNHMCRIMENLVDGALQEEFLLTVKSLWEDGDGIPKMVRITRRTEEEVRAALKQQGLEVKE